MFVRTLSSWTLSEDRTTSLKDGQDLMPLQRTYTQLPCQQYQTDKHTYKFEGTHWFLDTVEHRTWLPCNNTISISMDWDTCGHCGPSTKTGTLSFFFFLDFLSSISRWLCSGHSVVWGFRLNKTIYQFGPLGGRLPKLAYRHLDIALCLL